MTDNDFLSKGFKQFPITPIIDPDGMETHFQKRYDDEIGKKYFITVNKWKSYTHPYTRETFPPTYEYDVQLYQKGGRYTAKAIDLLFHSTWTIEEVENYMEKLFQTGLFEYYEKWEDC